MTLGRREFCLSLAGCAAAIIGCSETPQKPRRKVVVGKRSDLRPGLNVFPLERVAVRADGDQLVAFSLICTHQHCLLQAEAEGFRCPCHGAVFSAAGEVVSGPATVALWRHPVSVTAEGEVEVILSEKMAAPGVSAG